jgi:Family of unknown function (DUF6600)/FecR protein
MVVFSQRPTSAKSCNSLNLKHMSFGPCVASESAGRSIMRRLRKMRLLVLAGTAVLAVGGLRSAHAQDADDAARGVARISLMEGEVSVQRGDAGEWVAGVINAPLMTGDRISTAPNSRAEVQFDAANLLRIGGNAQVNLATLESGRYQIELARGTMTYVVLRPSSANVEVDTPSVSVRPSKQGVYRITVNDAGESQIVVRAGDVEVFSPRGSQWVNAGQMMMARGSASDPEFEIVNAIPLDDWDRWNEQRDQILSQTASYQYVPQGVYGVEDLDTYGSWDYVSPYGYVWAPRVAAGWAPYRLGRWAWEDWYGWTWISYDPWGWAPYHYGRWFWDTGIGWCWYPGVIGVQHYWSPALVAFFGFGHGGGLGFGFGNVGWVPLAPYEMFHPWWGRGFYGRGFNERLNIANVNISGVYHNARFSRGISAISATDFRSGHFGGIGGVSADQVRTAGLVRGRMPIAPAASHLQFTNHAAAYVPRSTGNTHFFTHQQFNPAQRVPFAQQQRAFAQSNRGGGAFGHSGMNAAVTPSRGVGGSPAAGRGGFAAQQPAGRSGMAARDPQLGRGGWSHFGEPSRQGGSPAAGEGGAYGGRQGAGSNPALQNTRPPSAGRGAAPANRGGWGGFGEPRSVPRGNAGAPRSYYQGGSGASAPRYSAPAAPSVVRERPSYSAPSRGSGGYSAPHYSAPSRGFGGYSAPHYSAPSRGSGGYSAPHYSAPSRGSGGYSAPHYSAPSRGSGGYSAPHYSAPSRGSGGARPSGGGGHGSGGGRGRH